MLVDWEIRECIEHTGEIKIDPYDPALIGPCSLDFRLGEDYGFLELTYKELYVDPLDKDTFKFTYGKAQEYFIKPQESVLVSMLERLEIADNIAAKIVGRSSIGRLGLFNSQHAGLADSGWAGVLTLELTNVSKFKIKLTKGMKIGQLVFHRTEQAEKPYGEVGRYQNQKSGFGSLGV